MEWCVRLGHTNIGHAFAASECRTMADFLSSPSCRSAVHRVHLLPSIDTLPASVLPTTLSVSITDLRKREEFRELGSFLRFLRALPTSLGPLCTSLSLRNIELESLEKLAALCDGLASPLCSISHLYLNFTIANTSDDLQVAHEESAIQVNQLLYGDSCTTRDSLIRNALLNNNSIRSVWLFSGSVHVDSVLYPALMRSACPIKELQVHLQGNHTLDQVHQLLAGLADNTIALTILHMKGHINGSSFSTVLTDSERQLGAMPRSNTSVTTLKLHSLYLPGQVIEMLFTSLERNLHITDMSLKGCNGPDWPSASLVLDSIRANGFISKLDLKNTPLDSQSQVVIRAQLVRNQENVEQRKVLKVRGSALIKPTTVRLFLCGLPYSGKTTLSRSLVEWKTSLANGTGSRHLARWNSTKSAFSLIASCLSAGVTSTNVLGRTHGIEISTLDYERVKVSLWDMAGQAEYFAFHDHMFPNLSNESTPSLFLYVWNPIKTNLDTGEEEKDRHGEVMIKSLEDFEQEFKYWLRFIASKTLKSLNFRPKLLVAVTRADLLEINIKSWFRKTFNQCQKDFEEYIHFDMEGVFEMDARDPYKVRALALTLFDCAKSLLASMPLEYQASEQARTVLARLVSTQSIAPLITKEEFTFFCKKHLAIDSKEMEEAIALCLNDSGDLIYFKTLDLVVVDTQWFCHQIMGDLLSFGNKNFQNEGFFSMEFLEDLLQSKVNSKIRNIRSKSGRYTFAKGTCSSKIEGKALVKLLLGLRLACLRDGHQENSDVFVPASLCARSRVHSLPSVHLKHDEGSTLTFMGRRLKCRNTICTFFTPGIFPLIQVSFNSIFCGGKTILEEDIIALSYDGIKVLIEFCKHEGQDHFIDILVHSRLDLDETIGWVYEEVINNVEKVCAEPEGIQGVELVHEVIRPGCVRDTVCMKERRNASVPVDELRNALTYHLERKGPQLDFLSVFHAWQTTHNSDRVMDLIGRKETLRVVEAYKNKFIMDVEHVLGINIDKESCSPKGSDQRVFSSSMSGIERSFIYNEVRKGFEEVHKDMQQMHKDIRMIGQDMQELCESSLPQLSLRMHELLGFFKEREVAHLPRMFVITRADGGRMRKIVGALMPSLKNVRLELLCEHRSQPHLVEEQLGLSLATIEDGLLKQGLPYINKFLMIAGVVMKVGAHVAAGIGNTVPDFTRVMGVVVNAPGSTFMPANQPTKASFTTCTSRLDLHEGQRWLHDVLSRHNCCTNERIYEVFGLTRVQYGHSHVGWLCDAHSSEGELCPV